ncbi:unnamed protein product, partial [Owenia fusiformis]
PTKPKPTKYPPTKPTKPKPTRYPRTKPTKPRPTKYPPTKSTKPKPTKYPLTKPTKPKPTKYPPTKLTKPKPTKYPLTKPTKPKPTRYPKTKPTKPRPTKYPPTKTTKPKPTKYPPTKPTKPTSTKISPTKPTKPKPTNYPPTNVTKPPFAGTSANTPPGCLTTPKPSTSVAPTRKTSRAPSSSSQSTSVPSASAPVNTSTASLPSHTTPLDITVSKTSEITTPENTTLVSVTPKSLSPSSMLETFHAKIVAITLVLAIIIGILITIGVIRYWTTDSNVQPSLSNRVYIPDPLYDIRHLDTSCEVEIHVPKQDEAISSCLSQGRLKRDSNSYQSQRTSSEATYANVPSNSFGHTYDDVISSGGNSEIPSQVSENGYEQGPRQLNFGDNHDSLPSHITIIPKITLPDPSKTFKLVLLPSLKPTNTHKSNNRHLNITTDVSDDDISANFKVFDDPVTGLDSNGTEIRGTGDMSQLMRPWTKTSNTRRVNKSNWILRQSPSYFDDDHNHIL